MPDESADVWASGDAYEPYVGRWSRLVARDFLAWLAPPAGARWLDVGCGTGALTEAILHAAAPSSVQGVDSSPAYLQCARQRVEDRRVTFDIADARALPQPARSVDFVVSGLALNFIPEPEVAAAEMTRVARLGGTVAAYVWDYADGMQLIRYFWDAAVELDATASAYDEALRFPLCHPAALEALLRTAPLERVASRAIDVPMQFRDFTDMWAPFLGGQGPAPSYLLSLADDHRVALRERLRARLPVARDGSIALAARAWAVRGTRAEASAPAG
jgi:trans-aconitate methyltransferase